MSKHLPVYIFSLLLLVFISISLPVCAQNTQKPYWQQKVDYKITVRLNDTAHTLRAFEQFSYTNNSPEPLTEIYIHLWPNAYKNDSSAFAKQQIENGDLGFYHSKEDDRGYIDSLDFAVNGIKVPYYAHPNHSDIVKILLPSPLLSGTSVLITTPFFVKIPKSVSRMGHVGQSYQVTQWYPKPAVYDKDGWHPIPYLDQGEFYSEFGTFEVEITLPKNYVIGATGNLQNVDEKVFLDSIANATKILSSFPSDMTFPTSSKEYKTLRYTESSVHDFAWFADKRFHVLKGEITLPQSQRKVTTWVMFTNQYAKFWKNSIEYMNDAILNYSKWNGEYAYQQATAVDAALSAGAGMEYPGVTVIGSVNSNLSLEQVIVHEVGHNWFYGMLGSNERNHGWMDEGMNTFNEQRYFSTKYPEGKMLGKLANSKVARALDVDHYNAAHLNYLTYLYTARTNEDQPIETSSEKFSYINYAADMYEKTGLVFYYLQNYLGTETFDRCMHTYFSKWEFKHPQPNDLQETMQTVSGKKLDWFFDEMIRSKVKVDFRIKEIKTEGEQLRVSVENKSNNPFPLFISSIDKNKNAVETFRTEPYYGTQLIYFDKANIDKIVIDPSNVIPEINQQNNSIRVKGMFKKVEPVRLQFLTSLQNRNRTQLFFMPVVGYNTTDGPMPGIIFYNHLFPFKKFEFELVPLYGTKSNKINGTGHIAYNWYPDEYFKRVTLSANYSLFNQYHFESNGLAYSFDSLGNPIFQTGDLLIGFQKVSLNLQTVLKPSSPRSKISNTINIRKVFTQTTVSSPDNDGIEGVFTRTYSSATTNIYLLNWIHSNAGALNPRKIKLELEYIDNSYYTGSKLSTEIIQTLSYRRKKQGAEVRLFAGIGFGNNSVANFSFDGLSDYKYDEAYFNRNDMYHRQFYVLEGGFKNQINLQNVDKLIALNIKIPFPVKLPVGIYADIANTEKTAYYDKNFVYDYGVYFPVLKNIMEVYLPLKISTYKPNSSSVYQPKYSERIRFIFNIKEINPFVLIKNFNPS